MQTGVATDITVDDILVHLDIHKCNWVIDKEIDYDVGFYDGEGNLLSSGIGGRIEPGKYIVLISQHENIWTVSIIGGNGLQSKGKLEGSDIHGRIYWRASGNGNNDIILDKWIGKICSVEKMNQDEKIKEDECGLIIRKIRTVEK